MVTNEPLYVEVNLPVAATKKMDLNEKPKLQVRYDDEQEWQSAEVIFLNPMINATANMQMTRLKLENPNHYRSGMRVWVKLPEGKLAAAQDAR